MKPLRVWTPVGILPDIPDVYRATTSFGYLVTSQDHMSDIPQSASVLVDLTRDLVLRDGESLFGDRAYSVLLRGGMNGFLKVLVPLLDEAEHIYISVQGLKVQEIEYGLDLLASENITLVYEDIGDDYFTAIAQMSWLRQQKYDFAVASPRPQILAAAVGMGAMGIVWNDRRVHEMLGVLRVHAAPYLQDRPGSVEELDALTGRHASLVPVHDLSAQDVLDETSLTVAITHEKGLSPFLLPKLTGLVMRYDLKAGEPLTFGYLLSQEEACLGKKSQ